MEKGELLKKAVSMTIVALVLVGIIVTTSVFGVADSVDVNKDGTVDGEDVILAARALGSYPGHSRWNSEADINDDDAVNGADLVTIVRNFGETVQ